MKPSSPSPSPPHGAAAVKQPASSPDARLTPSSVVAAAAVGIGVTPPRRSCDDAASVARLVDAYLAEAALEAGLRPAEFEELARAVPAHARAADDGLYRAVDTYLKAHPHAGKEERRSLCRLIDARKLTAEAAAHAVQNERLPVRCVVQSRSPADLIVTGGGANGGARCPSKREVPAQHHELRRLREDVSRLQVQCHALQAQVTGSARSAAAGRGACSSCCFGGRRCRWGHRGRRRGRLRQRVGQDAAEREEGRRRPGDRRGGGGVDAGVGHAGRGEVAQVALVRARRRAPCVSVEL
ncbi:hypothetical protein OsJ_17323 [Oryza sativa Japonica Group]|uniref:NPH3 domain-containing protein n=1 Tax=Oryza sativa subsp. japonica TaxID=39947 RepID=B9FMS1_ORYSJ|nr:hypothetical protein OsJ_17323 [Oryza sativa Japonica Group]